MIDPFGVRRRKEIQLHEALGRLIELAELRRTLAAVEALADEAERGEGIIITPGFSVVHAVEVGRLRAALPRH